MSDIDSARYCRHRSLISDRAWKTLLSTTYVIAGVGGLGSNVAQHLARVGPLQLELWDPGVLDEPDLNRQILYRPEHIGRAKVACAEAELRAINPDLAIATRRESISLEAFEKRATPHVIFDCLDSSAARLELERVRVAHQIPVVHGGAETAFGQAIMFPGVGPGYVDVFGDIDAAGPTGKPILSYTVATIAALQVGLLIRWAELDDAFTNPRELVTYDGTSLTMDRIDLRF